MDRDEAQAMLDDYLAGDLNDAELDALEAYALDDDAFFSEIEMARALKVGLQRNKESSKESTIPGGESAQLAQKKGRQLRVTTFGAIAASVLLATTLAMNIVTWRSKESNSNPYTLELQATRGGQTESVKLLGDTPTRLNLSIPLPNDLLMGKQIFGVSVKYPEGETWLVSPAIKTSHGVQLHLMVDQPGDYLVDVFRETESARETVANMNFELH